MVSSHIIMLSHNQVLFTALSYEYQPAMQYGIAIVMNIVTTSWHIAVTVEFVSQLQEVLAAHIAT